MTDNIRDDSKALISDSPTGYEIEAKKAGI